MAAATVYGGLTAEECELLAGIATYSPEITEREKNESYLLWGKWLVDTGIVSDWPSGESDPHMTIPQEKKDPAVYLRNLIKSARQPKD